MSLHFNDYEEKSEKNAFLVGNINVVEVLTWGLRYLGI